MKKTLLFVFIRYFEFGLTSLLYFGLARRVDPVDYGESASSFILVTFSAFFALGANQALVKYFSKTECRKEQKGLVAYSLAFNFIASIIAFFVVLGGVSTDYALYVAIIASGKLLLEAIVTVNRVFERLMLINVTYLSVAIPFSVVFWFGEILNVKDFFMYWSIFIVLGVLVSFSSGISVLVGMWSTPLDLAGYIRRNYKKLTIDGFKLAAIGVLAPFLSSGDKLFLSYTEFSRDALGSMQLADNISMVIAYGLGAFIFVLTPKVIRNVHNGSLDIDSLFDYGYKLLFLSTVLILFTIKLSMPILELIFPMYDLSYPLAYYMLSRILVSGLFMFNIYVMVYSVEFLYLKFIVFSLMLYFILLIVTYYLVPVEDISRVFPVMSCLILLVLHLRILLKIRGSKMEEFA